MMDSSDLKQKIEFIKKHDPSFGFFGASTHRYGFNKCLSEESIRQVEAENNIQLPADYLSFIATIGDGGAGPGYGLLSLREAMKDFKLTRAPPILLDTPFPFTDAWNAAWIDEIDWEEERPDAALNDSYMDVSNIYGALQLSHAGHGCTNLLVVNGKERGNIWFDGRADYSGIFPETIASKSRITFTEWYMHWLNELLTKIDAPVRSGG